MKILLVDDSQAMRRIQKNILNGLGYTDITEAVDGQDALAKLVVTPFDLVLLDWNMPNMDGFTLLKTVKADPNLKSVPIIMVTSESEKTRIIEAIKAGAVNYVVKPFSKETIQEKIQAVIAPKA